MKFDITNWSEANAGENIAFAAGRIIMKASMPAKFYVQALGLEILATVGHEIDIDISMPTAVRVSAPKGCRTFYYDPAPNWMEPSGDVLTNVERTPLESGAMMEVRKALRLHSIKQNTLRQQMLVQAQQFRARATEELVKAVEEPSDLPAEELLEEITKDE